MLPEECQAARAACVGPGVLEFGGRTFALPPATGPVKMAILQEWRRQCVASAANPVQAVNDEIAAAEKAGRPLHPMLVKSMVSEAMAARTSESKKVEPTDAEIAGRFFTLDGQRAMALVRLRQADPTVAPAFVAEHLPDMDAANAFGDALVRLDGLADLDPKKA